MLHNFKTEYIEIFCTISLFRNKFHRVYTPVKIYIYQPLMVVFYFIYISVTDAITVNYFKF